MTTFYIVRHGQSEANAQNIVQGTVVDTPLTEKGRQQAEQLADEFKHVNIDLIYASPAERAKETALVFNHKFATPIEIADDLHERTFGKYEGMPIDKFLAKYLNFNTLSTDDKLDYIIDNNEESNRAGANRLISFLKKIAAKHPDKIILVISHGGIIRPFLIMEGMGDFDEIGGLENTGWIKVIGDGSEFTITEMKGVKTWTEKHPKTKGNYSSSEEGTTSREVS